jgi:hypothetical protein
MTQMGADVFLGTTDGTDGTGVVVEDASVAQREVKSRECDEPRAKDGGGGRGRAGT